MSFTEGQPIPPGCKITLTKGYPEPVFMCDCRRMQCADIGEKVAERMGWELTIKHSNPMTFTWQCPFCAGNESKLAEVWQNETN